MSWLTLGIGLAAVALVALVSLQLPLRWFHRGGKDQSVNRERGGPISPQSRSLSLRMPGASRLRLTIEALPPEGSRDQPQTLYTMVLRHDGAGRGWALNVQVLPTAPHEPEPSGEPVQEGSAARGWRRLRLMGWKAFVPSLDVALFGLTLIVYAIVRLYRLEDWPIYFFTDEANQTLLALAFVRDGFRDQFGTLFPTFFRNVYQFNLSTSVYAQVIPSLLFGRSIFVTRATAALCTLPGAAAIALALRDAFGKRLWWLGVFTLSLTPAWFLHSRTAFETTMMVSFFACALYLYLRYRSGHPAALYGAVVMAGLAFYSHAAGQIVVVSTAVVLLLSDVRYHLQHRRRMLVAALLVVLVALPFVRFQITHPGQTLDHLYRLNSYWLQDIPLKEKLLRLVSNYGLGLSPAYWYLPNERDLPRHLMRGYGHISIWSAPFALLGLVLLLRRVREGVPRALLLAALTSPLGGVAAGVGITRVLAFTAPAAMITGLGLAQTGEWLGRWIRHRLLAPTLFGLLSLLSFVMLRDALVNGPTWYDDYGMGGLQYGARQIAQAVHEIHSEQPGRPIFISPTWANGTDLVMAFLLPEDLPVQTRSVADFLQAEQELHDGMLFVLTESEYQDLLANPKATGVTVERVLPYPDGRPGFYFVHWHYSEQAMALFEQERLERQRPVHAEIILGEETVQVEHSYLDMGKIDHVFDGDIRTLARGYEANPFRLTLVFSQPRAMKGLKLTTGSMDFQLTARLFGAVGGVPIVYDQTYQGLPPDPTVELRFERGPHQVVGLELEIRNIREGERAKIHLRELVLE